MAEKVKKKKGSGKKKKSSKRRSSSVKTTDNFNVKLVERDVVNDVEPLKCTCAQHYKVKKDRYKPHLCPIERKVQYTIYDSLYRTPVPKIELTKTQVLRRLESTCFPKVDDLLSVPIASMEKSKCELMLDKYKQLLQRHRNHDELCPVYSRIAALQIALGQYEDARYHSERATHIDPFYAAGYFQLGLSYYHLHKYDESTSALIEGLKHSPRNPRLEKALHKIQKLI